jgi:predicted RNA-binding protein YlqC (UPF0109 family)
VIELVNFLVKPLVKKPEAVKVHAVEGTASVLLELRVDPEDEASVRGPQGDTLRAIQQVLSAAGGARKPVLDLIQASGGAGEE